MRALAFALWLGFTAIAAATGATLLHACGVAQTAMLPLNFCPAAPPAFSSEARGQERLQAELAHLKRELADQALQCAAVPPPAPPPLELPRRSAAPRPQQTAALRPPPPPPPPPRPSTDLDAERWRNKDLSVLEGCWQLGHDTPMSLYDNNNRVTETGCSQKAGRLCFDRNGNGVNEELTVCPSGKVFNCRAPLTVSFSGDTLVGLQPDTPGGCGAMGQLSWRRYTCRRASDTTAFCDRPDSVSIATLEFRR